MTPNASITLTRDQVREVDRRAIEQLGIPGIVLMENAGKNAAAIIQSRVPPQGRVILVCGRGNNGGDGFVIARHLANAGVNVELLLACDADQIAGDAAVNHRIALGMGLSCHAADTLQRIDAVRPRLTAAHVIVDALLGTGFSGQVRPPLDHLIAAMNDAAKTAFLIAIDLPSGLDCDTGRPSNATIRAAETITFVARKRGFDAPGAEQFTGRVHVADIGVPPSLITSVAQETGVRRQKVEKKKSGDRRQKPE